MMAQTNAPQMHEQEVWVMSRNETGFRVYSPANPTTSYLVSGDPDSPQCSCTEFLSHQYRPGDSPWYCQHIRAVLAQFAPAALARAGFLDEEYEERLAIQTEGEGATRAKEVTTSNGEPSQMLIKRSVSPDGRIDSLSVEFKHSVDRNSQRDIKDKAIKTLQLQSQIVAAFLTNVSPKTVTNSQQPNGDQNGAIPATLVNIGGMNGKWGRRLFINVRANGQDLKLFGSKQQLSKYLSDAGVWNSPDEIAEGARLNLPCRITTRPSADRRFTDIDSVLPLKLSPT